MTADKKTLDAILEEIKVLIKENENPDGSFRFDEIRARVALEFAKAEIKKSVHE